MALTRIELNGRLIKPPRLGATPSGRAVLRLSLDCGQGAEPLPLEVVVMDQEATNLARILSAGQRIWAAGSLKAVRRRTLAGAGHQIEVVANEIRTESSATIRRDADWNASRSLFPCEGLGDGRERKS